MTGLSKMDCSILHEIIDRLAKREDVTDEETAQLIIHTSCCEGCKEYLVDAFGQRPLHEETEESSLG